MDTFIELMGYFASLVVLVSLLMTSVVKLRVLNSIGSAIYVVYALIIGSYPTALMNLGLVAINIYFLVKLSRTKTAFTLVELNAQENGLAHFLKLYQKDIAIYFPEFDGAAAAGEQVYMVYADENPAGVMIGRAEENGTLAVRLDYATPKFRDCSVGTFLYGELKESGIQGLTAANGPDKHTQYLRKMGFVETNGRFEKKL